MSKQGVAETDIGELDIADESIAERRSEAPGNLPEDMNKLQAKTITWIETMSLWSGYLFCLLLLPILFSIVYEVGSRSFFIRPTDWAYDISRWSSGFMFMAAAAYALMRGVHIRADFLYRNWKKITQATVDGWLYIVLFFPGILFFFWVSFQFAEKAWVRGELSMDTAWMAPVGPVRTAMPLGAALLLFQGVAELLRCSYDVRGWQKIAFNAFSAFFLLLAFLAAAMMIQLGLSIILPFFLPDASWVKPLASAGNLLEFAGVIYNGFMEAFSSMMNNLKGLGGIDNVYIGGIMIGVMLFAIFVGFPISFTLIFLGMIFAAWGFGAKMGFFLMTLQFNGAMQEQTLVAVPLFVFMGIMMEQAGLMERLFLAVQLLLSKTKGALFVAVLFVSTIFAAATGIVGASVTILGIMAAQTMNKSGYDVKLAAGTITAGGTLGILIPPSIMLVVMGPVLEIPVTDLFSAAIVPGILLAFLYTAYALIRCYLNPKLGPPLPEDEQPNDYGFVLKELFFGMVPPTLLVGSALGSILVGLATPTEAAACGALGAILLTLAYGKFKIKGFGSALVKTLEISVLILFLVAASNFFGASFSRLGTPTALTEFLLTLDLTPTMILILVMVVIFLLGWPLEWVPIVLIIVPILVPLLIELEVNLVWFAILVAVNLQTAWLSPPVALSAYFLKAVVPDWDLKDIYFGMMQFMVIQVIGLAVIFTFPQVALWLPSAISVGFTVWTWLAVVGVALAAIGGLLAVLYVLDKLVPNRQAA